MRARDQLCLADDDAGYVDVPPVAEGDVGTSPHAPVLSPRAISAPVLYGYGMSTRLVMVR